MLKWHPLRASVLAGMQDQSDVVARRAVSGAFLWGDEPDGSVAASFDFEHLDLVSRRFASIVARLRRNDQRFGVGVLHVEGEFLLAVGRIQRRRSSGDGRCQEGYDRRQSVG